MDQAFTRANGNQDNRDLLRLLGRASVISFDVFDTLLTRKLHRPADVFALVERQHGIAGFRKARIAAEHAARNHLLARTGSQEVTLEEIYRELRLPAEAGLDAPAPAALMQLELAAERSVLTASPLLAGLFETARATGKPIIALSDMYLPSGFIGEILVAAGMRVDRIFVSSEYRCSKHEGRLYGLAAEAMGVPPGRMLHFGDNFQADCAAALEAGVIGYHLPAPRDRLFQDSNFNTGALAALQSRAQPKRAVRGNLFASLLLGYLALFKARQPAAPIGARFGAMYGGPLVAGFAIWLRQMMQVHNVRHLRLAARDGYVIQAAWRKLGFEAPASVIQISRRLTLMPSLARDFDAEFRILLSTSTTLTLRKSIERLGLADPAALIQALQADFDVDAELDNPGKVAGALRALRRHAAPIRAIAAQELLGYQTYLDSEGFDPQTDALADCGWALSSQRRLETVLGRKLRGFYIGSLRHAHMHAGIHSFLFHAGKDRNWVGIAEAAVELLELPFATCEPQIFRFDMAEQTHLPVPAKHAENYEAVRSVFIEAMQSEILGFAEFIAPHVAQISIEEMRETLLPLYRNLVFAPTACEYHQLATLPHDREFGQSQFATIGTFWRISRRRKAGYARLASLTTLRDYLRIGWLSLHQAGVSVTLHRAARVLRRQFRFM